MHLLTSSQSLPIWVLVPAETTTVGPRQPENAIPEPNSQRISESLPNNYATGPLFFTLSSPFSAGFADFFLSRRVLVQPGVAESVT